MQHPNFIQNIVKRLIAVNGIQAIVLGGSWASGDQRPDSDIDLGLYYRENQPLDIQHLRAIAAELNDFPDPVVTGTGEWGKWVNGRHIAKKERMRYNHACRHEQVFIT